MMVEKTTEMMLTIVLSRAEAMTRPFAGIYIIIPDQLLTGGRSIKDSEEVHTALTTRLTLNKALQTNIAAAVPISICSSRRSKWFGQRGNSHIFVVRSW